MHGCRSIRVLRREVNSVNECNPRCYLLKFFVFVRKQRKKDYNGTGFLRNRKEGTTSSHYVSYEWGYTCNTMFVTELSELAIASQ